MLGTKTKASFGTAPCSKCDSPTVLSRKPMAFVALRKKGRGITVRLLPGGVAMIVYPRRCTVCGFVELFAGVAVPKAPRRNPPIYRVVAR